MSVQTGNNTSAAAAFAGQANHNAAAGSVSKAPIASLLYPGATTRVYAHFMPWFGGANHVNVGYESSDPSQIRRQVDDMLSRGIRGAIVDWYGPNFSRENNTTLALRTEAETRGGNFEFAVMEDVGALNACGATSGCDVTAQLIADLTYAYNTYEQSPAYLRVGGRPAVFFFGVERYAINWTVARAAVPGNPLFIFRNAGAFADVNSDGGFAWLGLSSNAMDMGLSYVDYFYQMGVTASSKAMFGTGYKGFNDSIAAWAPNPPRVLDQQCGSTWLSTLSEAGRYYSASSQLPAVQLVTWNDYEEGTEIETGVDNCVAVSAAVTGTSLSWTVTGNESTIDHYSVFISADTQNLMSLGDAAPGQHSFDLSNVSLADGNYQLFVKAVGKATIRNQMSAAVAYAIATTPPPPPAVAPDFTVAATPGATNVAGGQAAHVNVNVAPNAAMSAAVTLSCQNLPAYASCSFSPGTVNAAGAPVASTLTIATSANSAQAHSSAPMWLAGTQAFGLLGFVLMSDGRRRKLKIAAAVLALIALMAFTGCGGGATHTSASPSSPSSPPATPSTAGITAPGTYTVTVVATSGSVQHAANLTLVVQ